MVVEGVRPGERIPPEKAQLVADVLMDLMRYCNEEITVAHRREPGDRRWRPTARSTRTTCAGGPLPIVKASFGEPTAREQAIWKAELDKLVAEGDRLFHSDEIGGNGVACGMCHPNASNTHPETYPKFQTQLKKVAMLRDMVNWCILNPLEGKELARRRPAHAALEAYILAQRRGKPLDAGRHQTPAGCAAGARCISSSTARKNASAIADLIT